jgi:hypothetical protein
VELKQHRHDRAAQGPISIERKGQQRFVRSEADIWDATKGRFSKKWSDAQKYQQTPMDS